MVHAPLDNESLLNIQSALTWWQLQGAQFVNLPWVAPAQCLEHTRPSHVAFPGSTWVDNLEGALVASGEQAFLFMEASGVFSDTDPDQVFIGWTPCFRKEPVYDAIHHGYFLKAELFARVQDARDGHRQVVQWMEQFATHSAHLAHEKLPLTHERQPEGEWDICLGGVELGSYGVRSLLGGGLYAYGTALAEPRWSHALRAYRSGKY